jgi:FtsP/CotA-like multicopper oxidase with cupredoxin domain
VDAIVTMDNPGIWILGAVDDDDRQKGLGVVVEYANQSGAPRWAKPKSEWSYLALGSRETVAKPEETYVLDFAKIPGGRGGYNRWTINGKSFPNTDRLKLRQGRRYRLVMNNKSGDPHPVHLHRHAFEVTKFAGKPCAGLVKDTVLIPKRKSVEVDFTANYPGLTLFHCHQQDHMDEGFMMLFDYA